jgi:hypothetical protein
LQDLAILAMIEAFDIAGHIFLEGAFFQLFFLLAQSVPG